MKITSETVQSSEPSESMAPLAKWSLSAYIDRHCNIGRVAIGLKKVLLLLAL